MPETGTLVEELRRALGVQQVQFDHMSRVLYSTDASNYQMMPIGVTFPRHADDVSAIHEIAARYDAPVLPRGGGSSLGGQAVGHAVIMDFTRYMRQVRSINADERVVTVEAGAVLGQVNKQLAPLGLMFGPDPASAERATIGGCVGNNSSGAHSTLYGMTADHVQRLEVVLANGERVWLDTAHPVLDQIRAQISVLVQQHQVEIAQRYPKTFRTVAGYALNQIDPQQVNLNWLVTGSEGTLATILQAELKLVPIPTMRRLALVHFSDLHASLEATPRILELNPSAIELMDRVLMNQTRQNPEYAPRLADYVIGDPAAVLLVEFYGENERELDAHIRALQALLQRLGHHDEVTIAHTPQQQAQVWSVRKVGLGLIMSERTEAKPLAFIEDAAVPVAQLADYVSEIDRIVRDAGTTYAIYAHASAGCLHIRPMVNLKTEQGRIQYRAIAEAAADTAIRYSGTITGEHGSGLVRGEFHERLFGRVLMDAFREVKRLFDPHNLMNPGKIVNTPRMDDRAILRYTPAYHVPELHTRFDWSSDHGWHGAVEMCNGAGVCRKEGEGTMCPSFMATRDEAHATRGRANALRAAMSGRLQPDGLGSEAVHEVFDLCLSCKSCKAECPSSVDVARMKAEFLATYHDIHGVPLKTRLFANIHRLNALGSIWPQAANWALTSTLGRGAAHLLGLPIERPLPTLAARRFSQLAESHTQPQATLVIDTYTEFNHPELGQALLKVADRLGVHLALLRLPAQGCCGRPAISKGLLDQAQQMAVDNVQYLYTHLAHGPFVFLEPSCQSAFVDDYLTLVPPALQAKARAVADVCYSVEHWLADLFTGAEVRWVENRPREVLLHGHCHQKALWGTNDTLHLLRHLPDVVVTEIDSGCCGVAGSFGYEHYALSMKIAGQRLLPAIEARPQAWVAAPGTSCRTQITEAGYKVWHPVEMMAALLA